MINYKKLIDPAKIPEHVGIIMDGNGRWADKRDMSRSEGHKRGAEAIEPMIKGAIEIGIKAVSLFAFSTENWSRPKTEILGLWRLLEYFFQTTIDSIKGNGIKIIHSGSAAKLPGATKKIIESAVAETKDNKRMILNLCVNYGGRQEIVEAVNLSVKQNPGSPVTEKSISKNLFTAGLPELDLLIRTSGEYRVSNFLLWQLAYAELIFTNTLWPDFKPNHLFKSVYEYQLRKRRFGGL